MNSNQKINYDRICKNVQVWEKNEQRPTILMHVYSSCSTYTLEYLTKYADVTIYLHSSIHPMRIPQASLRHSRNEHDFNERTGNTVQYIEAPYEPNEAAHENVGKHDRTEVMVDDEP